MRPSKILTTYVIFCLTATGFNLGLQFIVSNWVSLSYWTALITGTLGGLILKYILDRNYIFNATGIKIQTDIKRFTIYSFFGIFTTLIFWLTEWVGYRFVPDESGRYVGGVIGLGLGYFCKYRMDRRWVFKS